MKEFECLNMDLDAKPVLSNKLVDELKCEKIFLKMHAKCLIAEPIDKYNFYMIFIIILFIKIFSFPLFLLILFDFYLYLSIHLCFEGMRRFQINLQGLYMQSGAKSIESSQLISSQA